MPDTARWCDDQSYSPELSPIETVREHLRGNTLSATAWESSNAIVEACRNVSTASSAIWAGWFL